MSNSLQPHGLVACQALLSVEFSRQEYWSGLPFPSPGDLPIRATREANILCRTCKLVNFFFFLRNKRIMGAFSYFSLSYYNIAINSFEFFS